MMNASATQHNSMHVSALGAATTRFIRIGRGNGWEGLRVLPIVAVSDDGKADDLPQSVLAD